MRHPATADARLGHVLDRTQAPMGSGLLFYIFHVFRKAKGLQPLLLDRTPTADGYLAVKLFITGFVRPTLLSMLRTPRPGGETRADAVALGPLEASRS
jgi:hypothetical protein